MFPCGRQFTLVRMCSSRFTNRNGRREEALVAVLLKENIRTFAKFAIVSQVHFISALQGGACQGCHQAPSETPGPSAYGTEARNSSRCSTETKTQKFKRLTCGSNVRQRLSKWQLSTMRFHNVYSGAGVLS